MAFLKSSRINSTADQINALIDSADASINNLVSLKTQLVSWSTTLAGNTTDFTNADRAEFQAEMTRLTNRINVEL